MPGPSSASAEAQSPDVLSETLAFLSSAQSALLPPAGKRLLLVLAEAVSELQHRVAVLEGARS